MPHPKKATERPASSSTAPIRLLHHLRKSGQPIVISINGQAELRVEDQESFEKLLTLVDRLETIDGIRRGLEDVEAGRTVSLEEFKAEKRQKYGLPG